MDDMKLKPYREYKESGVPWLGMVPKHWEVLRNKHILKEMNIRSTTGDEELLTVSHYTGITKRRSRLKNDNELLTNASSLIGYKKVEINDFVMNIMLAWNGSQGTSPYNGIVSPAYCVFKTNGKKILPKYLHYLHRSPFYTSIFKTASTGVIESRLRLYPEQYLRLPTAFPPISEQTQITRFLDFKTSQISRFISAKKRMIELLKEQKQAIINDAVTGKIDVRTGKPYPKYKESGVEWLGKVPEGWEVRKITNVCNLINDGTHFSPKSDTVGDYLYITAKNIKETGIDLNDVTYITEEAHRSIYSRCPVQQGDVLYIKDGATAGIATVNKLKEQFSLLSSVALIRTKPELLTSEFLALLLNSIRFKKNVLNNLVGGAMTRFTLVIIKQFQLVIPPIVEQQTIVSAVTLKAAHIDLAISRTTREISLLQEYRTRLIADVVTGKVDVREIEVPEDIEAEQDTESIPESEEPEQESIEELQETE